MPSSVRSTKRTKPPPRLPIRVFGRALVKTRDLDPVYCSLWNANLSPEELKRWLLAYWCFYHVGTASYIASALSEPAFWQRMEAAAGSKSFPRNSERRHYRGAQALASVADLKAKGVSALMAPLWLLDHPIDLKWVMDYVQTWRGFGTWISFKVADMLERVGVCDVHFDDTAMFLFDSPREGAHLLAKEENYQGTPESIPQWAVDRVLDHMGVLKAPPAKDRGCNTQEAETILCKWKSHMGGHYELGEDLTALRKGLDWQQNRISDILKTNCVKQGLWED